MDEKPRCDEEAPMPGDVRDQFDRAVDALQRISLLAQLRDRVIEARSTDRRECGLCQHWMKSRSCPREQSSMTGYSRGPSSGAAACEQFSLQPWVIDLKRRRIREAIEFAETHDLPVPSEPNHG